MWTCFFFITAPSSAFISCCSDSLLRLMLPTIPPFNTGAFKPGQRNPPRPVELTKRTVYRVSVWQKTWFSVIQDFIRVLLFFLSGCSLTNYKQMKARTKMCSNLNTDSWEIKRMMCDLLRFSVHGSDPFLICVLLFFLCPFWLRHQSLPTHLSIILLLSL